MKCPYVMSYDGERTTTYYAVCPACDNPIVLVGLFRSQEESRARRPYGRHVPFDVPELCQYDEDAYLSCPYANPDRRRSGRRRLPKSRTGLGLYRVMRAEFDRVVQAWEAWSGLHLGAGAAEEALCRWAGDEVWRYYEATYQNLPQTLFYGAPARNLVKMYVVKTGQLHTALSNIPEVRLTPTRSAQYSQVDKTIRGFLSLDFHLANHKYHTSGVQLTESFDLRVTCQNRRTCSSLTLETDPNWLNRACKDLNGRRDENLLDIARRLLTES